MPVSVSELGALLRENAPLIQGLFSFGGAALGGLVAMVTTQKVLNANLEREREARRDLRNKERDDRTRDHCDKFIALMYARVDWEVAQNERLVNFLGSSSSGNRGLWVEEPQPDHLAQLRALELLHLPAVVGTVGRISVISRDLRVARLDYFFKVRESGDKPSAELGASFAPKMNFYLAQLRSLIEGVAAKLVAHKSQIDYPAPQ